MKKLFAIIFTLVFALSLSACDNMSVENDRQSNSSANDVSSTLLAPAPESDVASQSSVAVTASDSKISREKAIEIALNHAGLKEAEVINLTAEYDREVIGDEWDVDFNKDNFEYSYEINAATGEIIKSEKEID